MVIGANELKTKGVGILSAMLQNLDEVLISVRGKNRFVVMDIERYEHLREYEIEHALREAKQDIDNGRYDTKSVDEHMKELKDAI